MKLLQKENGEWSQSNIFNLLVFLLGVIEIIRPYVPDKYIALVVVGVAVINLYLRTYSNGSPIQK